MRERLPVKTDTLAALGVAIEALALAAWSLTVMSSGISGERIVTRDGSETTLGIFMLVVAILISGIAFAVFKEVRWSSGPAITLQVLIIGGSVISTGFLPLPAVIGLVAYALIVGYLLITVRRRLFYEAP